MNKNKEYIKNTLILLIGKFATQFISFFLLPLYTHFLVTSDYGVVDLIQTYISLLIPILILRFDSAVFRFLIDERKNNNENGKISIITNVIISLIVVCIIFTFIYLGLGFFIEITYYWAVLFNIIVLMFSNVLLQIARGVGENRGYSISCILTSLSALILNLILILIFKFNASSILIASSVSNFICIVYLIMKTKLFNFINLSYINKNILKELLKYSLPMIPNGLSWWIVSVSDRTIISIFIGVAMNGIYTVACKFSNILNNIFSIFNMSWQESASMHIDDDDKDKFFTSMINQLLNLFLCLSLLVMCCIPLFFEVVIGKNYSYSFKFIPILLFANIFNIITQLFGAIYVAKKKTRQVMNTTLISASINLGVNFIFIRWIGLYAACFSTLIAYLIMAIYRYIDVQKYVKIKLYWKNMIISIFVFLFSSILYYNNNNITNILNLIIIIMYSIIINKSNIKSIKLMISERKK